MRRGLLVFAFFLGAGAGVWFFGSRPSPQAAPNGVTEEHAVYEIDRATIWFRDGDTITRVVMYEAGSSVPPRLVQTELRLAAHSGENENSSDVEQEDE